jgi:hypothetical protein
LLISTKLPLTQIHPLWPTFGVAFFIFPDSLSGVSILFCSENKSLNEESRGLAGASGEEVLM